MAKYKPEIQIMRYGKRKNILEYIATKKVTKIGTGSHILLPKELIGKIVKVTYKK